MGELKTKVTDRLLNVRWNKMTDTLLNVGWIKKKPDKLLNVDELKQLTNCYMLDELNNWQTVKCWVI